MVLNMSDLAMIAKQSFPLCMVRYAERVKDNLRIGHTGWLQYTGFLKDSGATVEHVSRYWERYYQAMGRCGAEIEKKKYDVRHVYGLEGQRKQLQPYSCRTIILSTQDVHGCPFRFSSVDEISASMSELGLSSTEKSEILSIDYHNHCQLTCTRLFNIVHRCRDRERSVARPIGYFIESREYREKNFEEFLDWDEEMVLP